MFFTSPPRQQAPIDDLESTIPHPVKSAGDADKHSERTSMKNKILVVYEKLGMGHKRMADIVNQMLTESFDAEVVLKTGSELVGTTTVNAFVAFWNWLLRNSLFRTADILVNTFARLFPMTLGDAFDIRHFFSVMDEIRPQLIVSTADIYNKALGAYAAERGLPLFIFIADISVYHDVVNKHAVHFCYFKETIEALQRFDLSRTYFSCCLDESTTIARKTGYLFRYWYDHILHPYSRPMRHDITECSSAAKNKLKCIAFGPLAKRASFQPHDKEKIAAKLRIKNDADNILIASGSIGGRLVLDIVQILSSRLVRPCNLLVMCGNDTRLYQEMKRLAKTHPHVYPYPWVYNFDEFMAVSACMVGRHSASVFVDSLVARVPCVAFGYVLKNDSGTASMIKKYGTGEVVRGTEGLVRAVTSVLDDRSRYVQNIDAFLQSYPKSHAEMKSIVINEIGQVMVPELERIMANTIKSPWDVARASIVYRKHEEEDATC